MAKEIKSLLHHNFKPIKQKVLENLSYQESLSFNKHNLWKELNRLGFFFSHWNSTYQPWQPTSEQWQWLDWALTQKGTHMFLGARGIGKTDILTVFRSLWMIVENPSISILLITGKQSRAQEIVRLITQMLIALNIRLARSTSYQVRTLVGAKQKSPTFYAAGIGSRIRGDHPDLIIIEDPLDEKEGYSHKKKELVMKTIFEARRMANDHVFLLGQFVAEDDPFAQLCREDTIAILTAWSDQCPQLIRVKKEDFVINNNSMLAYSWAINMEGEFPAKEENLFYHIAVTQHVPESTIIAVLDPAFGGSDATALAIGGTYYDRDMQEDVLVAWVFSWSGAWHQCIAAIVDSVQRLNVQVLYYEGKRFSEIAHQLNNFGIVSHGFDSYLNKQYKIEHASVFVALGRVKLHVSLDEHQIRTIRNWHKNLPHDDEVDALSMLIYRVFHLDKQNSYFKKK